jgi:sporulation protein YlmC with PRC-barrel domain
MVAVSGRKSNQPEKNDMWKSSVAVATLISATCLGPAFAQNQPTRSPQAGQDQRPMSGTNVQNQTTTNRGADLNFITKRDMNTWRATELMGKNVYGSNNEDIGEIGDILLNKDGRIVGVVLDVGGFLGLGETNVAVPMHALQFQDNVGNTTGTGLSGTAQRDTTTGQGNTTAARATAQDGPDRILLIVTKEQLESAPKFKDDSQTMGTNNNNNAPSSTRK